MKQVDQAIHRAFEGKTPIGKCRAIVQNGELVFYHYHHVLLKYDLVARRPTFQWHERPTDLRILNAALATLADLPPRVVWDLSYCSKK